MCKENKAIVFDEEINITSDIDECLKCNSEYIERTVDGVHFDCIWIRSVCDDCGFYWDVRYNIAELLVPGQ